MASVEFSNAFGNIGYFDARFFNVPENDVVNYFIWRQKDAERNSLNMVAQSVFSPKQLHKKNSADKHEMLHEVGINWNDCPVWQKRGATIIKHPEDGWDWDEETPIFSQSRGYIESLLPRREVLV
jgi:tRNA(His) 5'-end guanylyltransferase